MDTQQQETAPAPLRASRRDPWIAAADSYLLELLELQAELSAPRPRELAPYGGERPARTCWQCGGSSFVPEALSEGRSIGVVDVCERCHATRSSSFAFVPATEIQATRRHMVATEAHTKLVRLEALFRAAGLDETELLAWATYLAGAAYEPDEGGKLRMVQTVPIRDHESDTVKDVPVRSYRGAAWLLARTRPRSDVRWTPDTVRRRVQSGREKTAAFLRAEVAHGR